MKEVSGVVKFVGEEKMTPVQLALETARFEFVHLNGCYAINPDNPNYRRSINATGVIERIDNVLRSLGLMDRPSDQQTHT